MSETYEVKVEAVRLPQREENEAAKDYEQRISKVCAWLDEKGAADIGFSISANCFIEFNFDDELHEVPEGWWIVFLADEIVTILTDEQWQAMVNA